MPPAWLVAVSVVVLAVSGLSALATLLDILMGRPQKMAVTNVVWPVTCLYFGPFGYLAYRVMGRQGASEQSARSGHTGHTSHSGYAQGNPFWQGVAVSTCHCGAGCSIGDFIGEYALFVLGLSLFGSRLLSAYAVDFVLAYLLGIAFQFFAIAPMRNLGLREGLVAAIRADTLSLVAFELGMFGWMAVPSLFLFQPSLEPTSPVYWFMMQIATIVGFATSYPANWWLVKSGFKEAM